MQDYESRFYPAGSISALVEVDLPLRLSGGICNTVSLREIYQQTGRRGGSVRSLDRSGHLPCQDAHAAAPNEPLTLFCYARPTHPRNSFELLSEALRR